MELIKIKLFFAKDTSKKLKAEYKDWKYLQNIADIELVSKIHQQLIKFNNKKHKEKYVYPDLNTTLVYMHQTLHDMM